MRLLGYKEEQLLQKYSYPHGLSRGKMAMEIAPVFKSQLMIVQEEGH